MKFIGQIILGLFFAYCIVQNLVNIMGAMEGFRIGLDGSLRMWMVMVGGTVTSTIAVFGLLQTLKQK
jgi:hypothetical protein